MSLFQEIDDLKLTPEDTMSFRVLSGNKDFQRFVDYVERKILKMALAATTGTPTPGQSVVEYFAEVRGFGLHWKRIMSSVNLKEPEKKDDKN